MEQFNALPLSNRITIILVAMVGLLAIFYFLVLTDLEDSARSATNRKKQSEDQMVDLDQYASPAKLKKLEEEEATLRKQLDANREMLPEEEEIPDLIESIKELADERGLKINLFKQQAPLADDYVRRIPVEMHVTGQFPVLVSFFEAMAQPGMRMTTVDNIELVFTPIARFIDATTGSFSVSAQRMSATGRPDQRGLSATQLFLRSLEQYEAALGRATIDASFTVNAYSYTGRKLTAEERKKLNKRKKRRRRR